LFAADGGLGAVAGPDAHARRKGEEALAYRAHQGGLVGVEGVCPAAAVLEQRVACDQLCAAFRQKARRAGRVAGRVDDADAGTRQDVAVIEIDVGIGYGYPEFPEEGDRVYVDEYLLVGRVGLLAEVGAVRGWREYACRHPRVGQAGEQAGQTRDVVEVAVGQRDMDRRRARSGKCRQGLGQHALRFRSRIDDDYRSAQVLHDMDVFPYGAYTEYSYHARS